MKIAPFHAATAGVVGCAVVLALIVRPAVLAPHARASPAADGVLLDEGAHDVHEAPRDLAAAPVTATVYVAGAVARPGVYTLRAGARANDAILRAGGLRRDADAVAVNLAAHVEDGAEIAVPRIGERLSVTGSNDAAEDAPSRRKRRRSPHSAHRHRRRVPQADSTDADLTGTLDAAGAGSAAPIDLNTAGVDALSTLPGVGETLAERIVAFRQLNGPFDTIDGLADVSGMTERRVEAIEPLVTVSRVGAVSR